MIGAVSLQYSGGTRVGGAPMATFQFFLLKKMDGPYRRTQGGPRCHGPTFGPGVFVDTDTCC